MTEITKPVSHQDDDMFIMGMRSIARREESAGNEEIAAIINACCDKIEMWRERCESAQEHFEQTMKSFTEGFFDA